MSLTSEEKKLVSRMINAFQHFECFVFEKEELENVKNVLVKTGIRNLVVVKRADPRYEYIYMVVPWNREFETMCISKVKKLLAEGSIDRETYSRRYSELVLQCIRHYERERIKEIIEKLKKYISSGDKGGGKAFIIPP